MIEKKQNKDSEPKAEIATNITRLKIEWGYRLLGSLSILVFIFFLAGLILIFKNNWVNKKIDSWQSEFYDFVASQGFVLDDIIIRGREKTSIDEINALLELNRGDNILKIDVFDIKNKLEKLPWIKQAIVQKSFFPNVLHIEISEKEVKAIWQLNEKFYPLDENGDVIEAEYQVNEPILLIVGAEAPKNFKTLMDILKDEKNNYLDKVKVANFISGRRWNLILNDIREGITIKMPENNVEEAWKKLLKLNESKGIFKRKLTIIDLRLPDKVVVKIRKGPNNKKASIKKAVIEHDI